MKFGSTYRSGGILQLWHVNCETLFSGVGLVSKHIKAQEVTSTDRKLISIPQRICHVQVKTAAAAAAAVEDFALKQVLQVLGEVFTAAYRF